MMCALDFDPMEQETLGQRLRHARTTAGLTQEQVAKRCRVTASVVSQWELGQVKSIGAKHLMAAAKAVGVSMDWLLSGNGFEQEASAGTDQEEALLEAYRGLTSSQKARYLEDMERDAQHNRDLLRELKG